MAQEFPFVIFRPERKTGLSFQMFHCSLKFSVWTTQKVVFHLLSNRISRKLFVNGRRPWLAVEFHHRGDCEKTILYNKRCSRGHGIFWICVIIRGKKSTHIGRGEMFLSLLQPKLGKVWLFGWLHTLSIIYFWLFSEDCNVILLLTRSEARANRFIEVYSSLLVCNGLPRRLEAFPHFVNIPNKGFILFGTFTEQIFVKRPSLEISFPSIDLRLKQALAFFRPLEVVYITPEIFVCDNLRTKIMIFPFDVEETYTC